MRDGDEEQGVTMSYQPYPSGGSQQPYPGGQSGYPMAQRPPQPPSVKNAVRLMYGGGGLSALSFILVLAFTSKFRNAVLKALRKANATLVRQHKTPLTSAQMHSAASLYVVVIIVLLLVITALWVWMAFANNRGAAWARIVGSVLFALNTIYLLFSLSRASVAIVLVALGWLCGLGATILLWRKESTAYFKPGSM
jgi:hypothetical protein